MDLPCTFSIRWCRTLHSVMRDILIDKSRSRNRIHFKHGSWSGSRNLRMGWPMYKRVSVFIGSGLFVFLLAGLPLHAQIVTGDVAGTVTDQSGAAVAGATISAVCPDTNQTRTVTSGSSGEYRLSGMAICVYKVSVSSQGFKTTVRNVTVTVAQETKADLRLEVGQRTETITVEAASPLGAFSSGVKK